MVIDMLLSSFALLMDRRPHVYMPGWSFPALPKAEGSKNRCLILMRKRSDVLGTSYDDGAPRIIKAI